MPENCRWPVFTLGKWLPPTTQLARLPATASRKEKTRRNPALPNPQSCLPSDSYSQDRRATYDTMSDRRTYEGPMDWEYQSQPPVDQSSPFAKFSRGASTCKFLAHSVYPRDSIPCPSFHGSSSCPRAAQSLQLRRPPSLNPQTPKLRIMEYADQAPFSTATFSSPSKQRSSNPNPFAFSSTPKGSPLKSQDQPRPPHASFFNPQLQRKPSAPAFRNPAFTTPQKRFDELVYSEYSGAESSPAMTDTSEMPADTPEFDREEEDMGKLTLTPSAGKTLFSKTLLRNHAAGRGEIARVNRDKIRKRKRLHGDKDVGSVRSRLAQDSDDSGSDWEGESGAGAKGSKQGKTVQRSWFNNFLSAVSDHPSAPAILSKWLQLGVNIVLLSVVLFGIFAILSQIRSDLSHAGEKARAAIVNEMSVCAENFRKNACAPRANRPPALDAPCNEWEACMTQDASAIMKVQISARNVAEIMNEFVGVLTFKTWVSYSSYPTTRHIATNGHLQGFILSLFLVAVVASNVGFGFLRESTLAHSAKPAEPLHSPPVMPPMLGSAAAHNPQQAYIWAPLSQTPRHVRKSFFANEATDSEASPDMKMIMPPQTPSGRRSPSKGDRGRSPSKGTRIRSPTKGY